MKKNGNTAQGGSRSVMLLRYGTISLAISLMRLPLVAPTFSITVVMQSECSTEAIEKYQELCQFMSKMTVDDDYQLPKRQNRMLRLEAFSFELFVTCWYGTLSKSIPHFPSAALGGASSVLLQGRWWIQTHLYRRIKRSLKSFNSLRRFLRSKCFVHLTHTYWVEYHFLRQSFPKMYDSINRCYRSDHHSVDRSLTGPFEFKVSYCFTRYSGHWHQSKYLTEGNYRPNGVAETTTKTVTFV